MSILRSMIIAISCFSSLPMPQVEWDEKNMRYMMVGFPLVGVIIGACVWLWGLVCARLGFGPVLFGGGLTLIPIIVSGGIHMDGFADVIDAQTSHAAPERKREILKDPHTGAFAIIGVACYLVAYFAFASEVGTACLPLLMCAPVLSRTLSGFAVVTFKTPGKSGMYAAERNSASRGVVRGVLVALFVVVTAAMVWVNPILGGCSAAGAAITLACVKRFADRQFGGMSGDLSGFFLQVAELVMLIVVVVGSKLMGL